MEMVEAELKAIEGRFKSVLVKGEQAIISYSKYRRYRPKMMLFRRTMGFLARVKGAAKIGGKIARVLVIVSVVDAYQEARAAGFDESDALNQAAAEVINIYTIGNADLNVVLLQRG